MQSKKIILGITAFNHDSSTCLIKDNKLIAFCEEERFNNVKHTSEFPINSIKYCMNAGNISSSDITDVVFYFNIWKCIISYFRVNNPLSLLMRPSLIKKKRFYFEAIWLLNFINGIRLIKIILHNKNIKLHFVDHHLCHVWYGYYSSGFEKCAVVSNDSVGEAVSSLAVKFNKDKNIIFNKIFSQNDPNSIGYLYGAVTEFLGFKRGESEGIVMAMASFGDDKYFDYFNKNIKLFHDGKFVIKNKLITSRSFKSRGQRLSDYFFKIFGQARMYEDKIEQYHFDIANGLQSATQNVVINQIKSIQEENIVLTGGLSQNSVLNGILSDVFPDKKIFVPPVPNDAGCSIGAAIYFNYKVNNKLVDLVDTAFLGPKFSDDEVLKILNNNKIKYSILENAIDFVVEELIKDKVIGVFRDNMECGPRALGNRSILASPISKNMKDYLNKNVKYREYFRPYGGIILDENVNLIYKHKSQYVSSPHMSFVYEIKDEWLDRIPSLVHVDKTSRVQTIKSNSDYFLENILKLFYLKTNVPVVINTSLNIKGLPIARSPQDALNTFYSSGMDYIIFNEKFLISK